jgi:two-component system OmpR family response regulator
MNGPKARLLVVDDEDFIADVLASGLRFAGYGVRVARSGPQALAMVDAERPELVLLDVRMPGLDGFDVVRRLRRDGDRTPVVFLTARDGTQDKIAGLRLGGDDYVTKPFSLEEVVARVEAVLRRVEGLGQGTSRLTVADLVLDEDAHAVWRAGQRLELSPTEFNVLRYLMVNANRVVSRPQILERVWHYDFGGESTVVETYISYLRRKLDALGAPLIHTVRGVGYVIRAPDAGPR